MNLDAPLTDVANALEALFYCQNVYTTATISTPASHVLIVPLPNCIVVAHRGSESISDWLHDADAALIDTPYGRIHRGFWDSEAPMTPLLLAALEKLPKLPVVAVGHSLGGEQTHLSILTALAPAGYTINRAITFGAPRGGDKEWGSLYDASFKDRTIRFRNLLDPVPALPSTLMGYVHVGHEGFLSFQRGLELDPAKGVVTEDDAEASIFGGQWDWFAHHHLESYKQKLDTLCTAETAEAA